MKGGVEPDIVKKLLVNTQTNSHFLESVHSHIMSITANLTGKKKSLVVYICIVLVIKEMSTSSNCNFNE